MLESSQRDTLAHQGEHPWYRLLLHGQHVALKQWVERWGCPQQATDSAPETSTWFHAAAWSACPVTLAFAAKLELPNINAQDANGLTPLIIGIHRGDEAFVDALIRAGADPMMADQQGRTAMHHAAQYGDVDILSHLEDAGGVVESEDEYGLAANELAKARRHSNPKERATLRQHWERRYQQLLSF